MTPRITRQAVLLLALTACCQQTCHGEEFSESVDESRRCDFPIVDAASLTPEEFKEKYMDPHIPVLLQNAMTEWPAYGSWSFDSLPTLFPPKIKFRVGNGPYPDAEMTMPEYLDLVQGWDAEERGEGVPGIFQYGQVPTGWTLWGHKHTCVPYIMTLYPKSQVIHTNVSFACEFLSQVQVPQFLVGNATVAVPKTQISHSGLLIGREGAGIDYHKHQDAINAVFDGEKHWYMIVPKSTTAMFPQANNTPSAEPVCAANSEKDGGCTEEAIEEEKEEWMLPPPDERRVQAKGQLAELLQTTQKTEEAEEEETEYMECVQKAGEVIYIPEQIQHGVINRERSIAMQMQWDRAHWDDFTERESLKKVLREGVQVDYNYE